MLAGGACFAEDVEMLREWTMVLVIRRGRWTVRQRNGVRIFVAVERDMILGADNGDMRKGGTVAVGYM